MSFTYKLFDNDDDTYTFYLHNEHIIISQYSVTLGAFPMSIYIKGFQAGCAEQGIAFSQLDDETAKVNIKIVNKIFKEMNKTLSQYLNDEGYA